MKKRMLSILALLALTAGFAFANGAGETVDIGYCVPDTTNPFVGWLTGAVKELADAEGLNVQIADAANSPVKQVEQIENFIAMNVKVIDIMPVDPNNVQDVIKRAQAKGIKVLVAGTDTGVYDVMMNMNQYNCGEQIAEMGIDWMIETFSSDGTEAGLPDDLKVLVIKNTTTIDSKNRSSGIIDKITAWGKAEVVVSTAETMTASGAMDIMENMWQQNSDAVCVLSYNADGGLGANEYLMGQVGLDKSKLAVFSGDWSPPIQEVMDNSVTNDSVFRGTMQIVGPQINGEGYPLEEATYMLLKDLSEGNLTYGHVITDAIQKAYPQG